MWLLRPDSLINIAHLSKFMLGGPWTGRPLLATILQGQAAVALADPLRSTARTSKRHIADRERGLVVLP
jgi:hypothetical protein